MRGMWKLLPITDWKKTVQVHLISLRFTDQTFFTNVRFVATLQVCWCHSPKAFAHSVSLCHILVILLMFQTLYYYICYGDLQSVIMTVKSSDDGHSGLSTCLQSRIRLPAPQGVCFSLCPPPPCAHTLVHSRAHTLSLSPLRVCACTHRQKQINKI